MPVSVGCDGAHHSCALRPLVCAFHHTPHVLPLLGSDTICSEKAGHQAAQTQSGCGFWRTSLAIWVVPAHSDSVSGVPVPTLGTHTGCPHPSHQCLPVCTAALRGMLFVFICVFSGIRVVSVAWTCFWFCLFPFTLDKLYICPYPKCQGKVFI